MADERKTFLLRADPALWKEIEKWAADELRSVNGQIEFILREAVRRRRRPGRRPGTGPRPRARAVSRRRALRRRRLGEIFEERTRSHSPPSPMTSHEAQRRSAADRKSVV